MLQIDQREVGSGLALGVEPGFDFLSPEYRAFYGPSRATAFQAPIWMDMLHRRLAPSLKAEQLTITARRPDGALAAVIPLVRQRVTGLSVVQPADFGVCDYNSAVADPETLEALAGDDACLAAIDRLIGRRDVVFFRKVRADRFDAGRLFGRTRSSPGENAAYHSEIGDDFDQWRRRTIRRKFSKELERLQRQTEREFGGYEHRAVEGRQDILAAFDFLQKARRGRFKSDPIDDPLYFEFYRDYALAACEQGEARGYMSTIGGEPAAFLFGLTGDDDFHAVLIAADMERFGQRSPGTQLLYQVIRQRFAEGFRIFDMGLGNTGYKTHFRVEETEVRNHTKARTLPGMAMAFTYHHAKPAKNLLRKYVFHVR